MTGEKKSVLWGRKVRGGDGSSLGSCVGGAGCRGDNLDRGGRWVRAKRGLGLRDKKGGEMTDVQ